VRVAYYSPLPPERSGIADYSALLLPTLKRRIEVDVIRRGRTRPAAADVALYHVGNDPESHGWIVEALSRRPGVVVLHDFVLHHLVAGLTLGRHDGPAYLAAMERDAGIPGRLLAHGVLEGRVAPLWETRPEEFPLVRDVLEKATGLIVHSHYVEQRARRAGYDGPLWRIPHPAWPMSDVTPAPISARPLFGCFGHLNASKRIPQLLEAFAVVRARHRDARLLLVGSASPRFDVSRFEGDGVERLGYVDEAKLWSLMAACDACISLRAPTMGETSGSVIRALALGRPLVVSDVGWFSELPDEVALKVPVDDEEVPSLAASLELLAASEAKRRTMSDAAREYVTREHHLEHVADLYVAALEEAAGGPEVSEAVVDEVARAAADVGVEAGTQFSHELAARLEEVGLSSNGRAQQAPAPPSRGRLAAVPVWAWLAGIVVASAIVRYALSRRVAAPWIMVDELIYSELAKSFAATGHFLIRDEHHGSYGFLYPLLISPAWKAFAAVPQAYAAAKAIGSVAMSLAAVPAFFLARRVLSPRPSLFVALLAVAIPSMAYTGTLMTETVFYPVFLCVALALVLMLEEPTAMRQLVLLATCLVAFLIRTQAVVLVPAVATAPLVLAWADRSRLRTLARFRVLYGVLAGAVVAVLVVQAARGRSPYDVFGSYNVLGHTQYHVGAVLRWLVYHVAELDLYLGVLPFAALLLVTTLARSLDRRARTFVAAAVSLTAWLVLQVSAFASAVPVPPRVEERNMFYVAPLFLVALLVWIERGMPRPARAAAVCTAVAAALPGVLPFERLIDTPAESDELALLPFWWLQEHLITISEVALVVVIAAVVLGCAFLFASARWAYALPFVVLAWFVFTTERLEDFDHGFPKASIGARYQGIKLAHRDWVDRILGHDANVAFVWSPTDKNAQFRLWENEFFNRSVGTVYDLHGPSPGTLPETPLHRRTDGALVAHGRLVRVPYVLADARVPLAGGVVARDQGVGMVLRRLDGPLAIADRIGGLYPNDTWSGREVTYTRYRCRGGTVSVDVNGDARLFHGRQTVSAEGRKVSFLPTESTTLIVPLRPRPDGTCRVAFRVRPTAIPALVVRGSSDARVLGAHFTAFRYRGP